MEVLGQPMWLQRHNSALNTRLSRGTVGSDDGQRQGAVTKGSGQQSWTASKDNYGGQQQGGATRSSYYGQQLGGTHRSIEEERRVETRGSGCVGVLMDVYVYLYAEGMVSLVVKDKGPMRHKLASVAAAAAEAETAAHRAVATMAAAEATITTTSTTAAAAALRNGKERDSQRGRDRGGWTWAVAAGMTRAAGAAAGTVGTVAVAAAAAAVCKQGKTKGSRSASYRVCHRSAAAAYTTRAAAAAAAAAAVVARHGSSCRDNSKDRPCCDDGDRCSKQHQQRRWQRSRQG